MRNAYSVAWPCYDPHDGVERGLGAVRIQPGCTETALPGRGQDGFRLMGYTRATMSGVCRLYWNIQPAKAHHAAADVKRDDDPAPAYAHMARILLISI
jgi:hypothetical protein